MVRIGIGYDVHRLVAGRPLVLGGVSIPHSRGLAGHSDADVLVHALMDALLGAVGEADIGNHFPDTDPAYKDVSSLCLLEQVMVLVRTRGFAVLNVDTVVVAQEPRLAPYINEMKLRLAYILGIARDRIGIKATTSEYLGFTGRGEGIAAQAVVLLAPTGAEPEMVATAEGKKCPALLGIIRRRYRGVVAPLKPL